MWRGSWSGLLICALVLVAAGARGYAAEEIVKAAAPIKGEGRFYKTADDTMLFSGYFQGIVEVDKGGILKQAGLVCPSLLDVNLTAGTQQGEGRCILLTQGGDFLYGRFTCTGKPKEGCAGTFTFTGGTGKFSKVTGESQMALRSDVLDVVKTVPA